MQIHLSEVSRCFAPPLLQLISAIQGVDKVIGQLMNGLKQLDLHECVNIVIVADHGELAAFLSQLTNTEKTQLSMYSISFLALIRDCPINDRAIRAEHRVKQQKMQCTVGQMMFQKITATIHGNSAIYSKALLRHTFKFLPTAIKVNINVCCLIDAL